MNHPMKRSPLENEPDPQAQGQTLSVTIEKMVYGGEGLARTPEGVVLIPLVLPGETVRVEMDQPHKGVRRGRLLEVIDAAPGRVEAGCPYFKRCGGCQYQHIDYSRQLEYKKQILIECFERIGKIHLDVPVTVVSGEPWQYRNRTRLQLTKHASHFEIGYFELLSHRLCAIDRCPISSPSINQMIELLAGGVGFSCFPDGSAEIELFASDSGQMLATVYSNQPVPPDFAKRLKAAIPSLESVCWQQKIPGKPAKRTVWGNGALTYHVGEFHYRVSHDSFFQANRFLLRQFVDLVLDGLEGKKALELYAGVGFFTVPLAHRFETIAAVESSDSSAADLASNIGVAGARVKSYRLTAEKFLATASPIWDSIIADPPRAGLSTTAREHIARLRPEHFVYISCDPTTLVRDIADLLRSGYHICSVHLIDQFPQTFHLETVVRLEHL